MGELSVKLLDLDPHELRRPLECPVEEWLSFLGHRWNALILWHLKDGAKRYGELARLLPGISAKVLSERLQQLEHRDLLVRSAASTFPRSVTYSLSRSGSELTHILDQVEVWARRPDS